MFKFYIKEHQMISDSNTEFEGSGAWTWLACGMFRKEVFLQEVDVSISKKYKMLHFIFKATSTGI